MWLNVNSGKVNLLASGLPHGAPHMPQGLLVTHMLAGPALLHSPIAADQP